MSEETDIRAETYANPDLFCKWFLSHWFTDEMSWFHLGALAILTRKCRWLLGHPAWKVDKIRRNFVWRYDPQDPEEDTKVIFRVKHDSEGRPVDISMAVKPSTLIMWPRGFGKTTIMNASVLYDTLFIERGFIVYIGETSSHAESQLENVKTELEVNSTIQETFGQLVPDRHEAKWTAGEAHVRNGVILVAKGAGGQVRGLNIRAKRPDRIILDDVEDRESVQTEERRQKRRSWFYGDVMPALTQSNHLSPTMEFYGTLLHPEALLTYVARDEQVASMIFAAVDSDGDPVWPQRFDAKALEQKKRSMERAGELATFYLEYYNIVRAEETASFSKSMIQYGEPKESLLGNTLVRSIALDPAISEKRTADYAAIAVLGIEPGGMIYVLDVWLGRGYRPRDLIDKFFAKCQEWQPHAVGIEKVAFQQVLVHLMQEEMARRREFYSLQAVEHSGVNTKFDRIMGILQPRYQARVVWHRDKFHVYEQQLLDFPQGHDDGPDAAAMAIELLDSAAGYALGSDSTALEKPSYEPLESWLDEYPEDDDSNEVVV